MVVVAVVDLNLLVPLVVVVAIMALVDDGRTLAANLETGEAGVDHIIALNLVDIVLSEVLEHCANIEVFLHGGSVQKHVGLRGQAFCLQPENNENNSFIVKKVPNYSEQ